MTKSQNPGNRQESILSIVNPVRHPQKVKQESRLRKQRVNEYT